MRNHQRSKGLLAVALAMVMGCLSITGMVVSYAENQIPMAPGAIDPTVRVYLSRLGLTDRLDVTLTTPYGLFFGDDGAELYVESGSHLAFLLRNNAIYLYMDGLTLRLGDRVQLRRYAGGSDKPGFYRTTFEPLYQGDLSLSIVEGKLYPVLSIHVEDYLLGVVPYEMGDGFPLEALKAQAIACRTYALRKVNPEKVYDVVDTTSDQVYRGYVPGSDLSEKAVAETRGICGFYKGKLAQCYYSASNGGQMERVQTVWPTNEDFGYYTFGQDPYDVENPASTVRSFAFQKEYTEDQAAPYRLRKLLADVLAEDLMALGYDPTPEGIQVRTVSEVVLDTPSAKDSLHLTRLRMTVTLSGRSLRQVANEVDLNDEEVFLFETPIPATPSPSAAVPTPTQTPAYGPFVAIEQPFEVEVPIFPTAENAFGMSISSNYENEIWSLVEDEEGYELQARRYGHGVGMSQRGAERMAGTYEKDFREILAFYYPGMQLMRYAMGELVLPLPEAALSATAGPAPTATPRPTLMPLTQAPASGQWIATVTEIDDDSSLNLRSRPDLGSEILMRLYKHQRLLVLERCPEEGWVRVQTDSINGYVMESYLTAE